MATSGRTTKLDDDLAVSAIGFGAGALTSIYGDVDDAESLPGPRRDSHRHRQHLQRRLPERRVV